MYGCENVGLGAAQNPGQYSLPIYTEVDAIIFPICFLATEFNVFFAQEEDALLAVLGGMLLLPSSSLSLLLLLSLASSLLLLLSSSYSAREWNWGNVRNSHIKGNETIATFLPFSADCQALLTDSSSSCALTELQKL